VELPTVLVGIAVLYNVPGSATSIRLSGPVLANIYLGRTTSWSDPEIARLNPDGKLPDLPIKVLHRTDGKGSNYIFSDFLSKLSPEGTWDECEKCENAPCSARELEQARLRGRGEQSS